MTDSQLDAAQAQELLGISSATFYRWLREKNLTGIKVGGRWRFERSAIEALLGTASASSEQQDALRHTRELCAARLKDTPLTPKEIESMNNEDQSDAIAVANMLVGHAVARKATDLHVAPHADGLGVRERIDGVLSEVGQSLPKEAAGEVVDAFKELAGLEVSVTDRPQGGHFFADVSGRKIDVRASTFPTWQGESLTLRLLDPNGPRQLKEIGFSESIYVKILEAIRRPSGVFLVNGPTGNGKSTTLYCALANLVRPGLKVMTAEDPVEYRLDGVLQANVTSEMSHLDAMKAMLQNDLDVGLVSELRDPQSMRLFFQMAVTGHMMFSGLHAPDALSALSRVLTVGEVEPRFVCETLRGILDQRLVGRSCRHCREQGKIAPGDAKRLELSSRLSKGLFSYNPGCDLCNGTGNLGRVPVAEFLEVTPKLVKRIEAGETAADALRGGLPKGHRSFRDDVIAKLREGEISPPEAIRVLDL